MGATIYPSVPVAQPAAEPWPIDEHTIRVDEMFARQLDSEFATGVRGLLHDPETGISALSGEAALEAIAGAMPALSDLKERTLAQAIGPRQRSILEPMIETRLGWATGTLGQLAQRATVEVDDQSVADRIAGLNLDAATAWQDPAHLRKLGRSAVEELRYQGERRGWDPAETDTKVRGGLSDLYAGAVESAMGKDDLDGAVALYDHARAVIDPERQAAIERKIEQAREARRVNDIVAGLADTPDDPTRRPALDDYQTRAAELTPPGASPEERGQVSMMARIEQARADRAWQAARGRAAMAALDWLGKNPAMPLAAMPTELRDGLSPEQTEALDRAAIYGGRVVTDRDLYERLDDQAVHDPENFAVIDLAQYRLSLGDGDFKRLTGFQTALVEGKSDPTFERHRLGRSFLGEGLRNANFDPDGAEARTARQQLDRLLRAFETVEGKPPTVADIRGLAGDLLPRANSDPNIVRVSGGELVDANGDTQIAQQQEPAPGSPESQAATTKTATDPGKRVVLPNGKSVPSFEDPKTEFLMSPVEDLREVAAAGRETGSKAKWKLVTDPAKIMEYGRELVGKDLAQGGRFDYQRLWIPDDDAPGYLQLPQFRDVSNFNVGLYMQQAGIPKWMTLRIAGRYAKENSSNYMPNEPYGLDPRVKRWIERGYAAGESGAFNLPFLLKKNKAPPRTAD